MKNKFKIGRLGELFMPVICIKQQYSGFKWVIPKVIKGLLN
jgi:hypothetical protein